MSNTKIYSTLSNDVAFPVYSAKPEGDGRIKQNRHETSVLIKGGAGIQNRDSLRDDKKPYVETEVSKEHFDQIKDNAAFKRMIDRGFFTIGKPPVEPKLDKSTPVTDKKKRTTTNKAVSAPKQKEAEA